MSPAGEALFWRPPLCLGHDPEHAGLCAEPPVDNGVVRCSRCLEGMGLHADIIDEIGHTEEQGDRATKAGVLRALRAAGKGHQEPSGPDANGYLYAPVPLSKRLETALAMLFERGLVWRVKRSLRLTVAGQAVKTRITAAQRQELDAAMDAAMALDALDDARRGDDALGDLAADAAREQRVFGTCRWRR